MLKKLQAKLLWFLVPPAVAMVMFLGPLGNGDPAGAAEPAATEIVSGLTVPATPGLWQVGSSLLGVLLIGAVGVMIIARLKGVSPLARPGDGNELLTLRQSLRISSRHHVHAIEFDGRVLLVGECENNLAMLTSTDDPNVTADERAISARVDECDSGADLRDTPRPAPRVTRKAKKKRSTKATPKPAQDAPTPQLVGDARAATDGNAAGSAAAANLADFKSLLKRARRKASV